MVVVDASVWVSRFVAGDVHHTVCARWLGERVSQGQPIVAPAIVLMEVAGAVSIQTGKFGLAHQAVEGMLQLSLLRLVALDASFAEIAARLAADLMLRGADAAYVAVAYQLGIPLVTLDSEQRKRAGRSIKVDAPRL